MHADDGTKILNINITAAQHAQRRTVDHTLAFRDLPLPVVVVNFIDDKLASFLNK